MKNLLILLFITVSMVCCISNKPINNKTKTILFVGNSLTYVNDMPKILERIFATQGMKFEVVESTYSGITLQQHASRKITINNVTNNKNANLMQLANGDTSTTFKLIYSRNWDYIVLQEGTIRVLIPEARSFLVIPAIRKFKEISDNKNTQLILFKTWPTLDTFPKQYCYPKIMIDKSIPKDVCCSDTFKTINAEAAKINESYDIVSKETKLPFVPVTECYLDIINNYPLINLYQDKTHPSNIAAYMNACIFYKYITKKNAASIKYYADIEPETVKIIHNIVDRYLK